MAAALPLCFYQCTKERERENRPKNCFPIYMQGYINIYPCYNMGKLKISSVFTLYLYCIQYISRFVYTSQRIQHHLRLAELALKQPVRSCNAQPVNQLYEELKFQCGLIWGQTEAYIRTWTNVPLNLTRNRKPYIAQCAIEKQQKMPETQLYIWINVAYYMMKSYVMYGLQYHIGGNRQGFLRFTERNR